MYNNNNKNSSDHKKHNLGAPAPMNMNMSPRISFSTDFIESSSTCSNSRHQHLLNLPAASRPQAPGSSDFEFSVSSYSMMSADELFSQGRLLPFKNNNKAAVTLREELLTGDDDDNNSNNNGGVGSSRPPKSGSSGRWKGLLSLRKSHVGPKKSQREDQVQSTSQHFAGHNE